MSLAILERVRDKLATAGLMAGYSEKWFRWTDADAATAGPFIMFRLAGSGPSNILLQQLDVSIVLVGTATTVTESTARAAAIQRMFREAQTQTGVIRFEPMGVAKGPQFLEGGRPLFEQVVRVLVEDH